MSRHQLYEARPRHLRALTSTVEPFPPRAPHLEDETFEAANVALHAEVVDVATYASDERLMLLLDRLVPVAPAPVVDGRDRPSQARTSCLEADSPVSRPARSPEDREAEEI